MLWMCDGAFIESTHQHVALLGCQFNVMEAIECRRWLEGYGCGIESTAT